MDLEIELAPKPEPEMKEFFNPWGQYPKPPPRVRTPYAFFVSDYYRRYRRHLRTRNPREIIHAIVNHWRQLDHPTRQAYVEKNRQDKIRFKEEIEQWRASFKNGRAPHCRRKRKNPLAPKRTRNGYIFYQQEVLPRFRQEHPNDAHRDLIRRIGWSWRRMSKVEKVPYQQRCNDDKVRYRNDLQQYRIDRAKRLAENVQRRQTIRLEELKQRRLQEKFGIPFAPQKVSIIVEIPPEPTNIKS